MKARCIDEKHSPELWPLIGELEAAVRKERDSRGNQHKMREALVEALNKVNDAYDMLSKPCVTLEEVRQSCREARGIIIPALSEPARNCDIYTTSKDADRAITEYCSKMAETGECAKSCPYRESEGGCAFGWLLAKAAERKGNGDGCD
jgi:hypothetical protein